MLIEMPRITLNLPGSSLIKNAKTPKLGNVVDNSD